MSFQCRILRDGRIGLVMDDLDELTKKNFLVGARSVDDHAHHLLKVGIECGSLRHRSGKPQSMKRHNAHNTRAKKRNATTSLARGFECEMCMP